jgi:hypothetical protein
MYLSLKVSKYLLYSNSLCFAVGTLDSLMALSDDLSKVDSYVENVTRKIATQLFDLLDTKDKYDSLSVNNSKYQYQ